MPVFILPVRHRQDKRRLRGRGKQRLGGRAIPDCGPRHPRRPRVVHKTRGGRLTPNFPLPHHIIRVNRQRHPDAECRLFDESPQSQRRALSTSFGFQPLASRALLTASLSIPCWIEFRTYSVSCGASGGSAPAGCGGAIAADGIVAPTGAAALNFLFT